MSGNFIVYLIGYIIAIAGVAYAMNAAGLGEQWVIAAVLILIGLGIVYALSRSQRDTHTRTTATQPPGQTVINQQAPGTESHTTGPAPTRTTTH